MTTLKAGQAAPNFKSTNEKGETVSLSDFKGKKLALYFYPRDNTPTCTVQACNFRDGIGAMRAAGYTVLGVSPDSEKRHQNFIAKFDLPFSLLADTDNSVALAYGVYGPKKFMGRTFDGIHRVTFLINEQGNIDKVIDKVKAKEHVEQVLGLG